MNVPHAVLNFLPSRKLGFSFRLIGVNFLTISSQILSHVMRDSARLLAFSTGLASLVAITMFVADDSCFWLMCVP